MTMKTWFRWPVVLSAAVMAFCMLALGSLSSTFASAQAPEKDMPMLPLPLRLTTWAVSMGTIATGRNNVIEIRITRWTTPEERVALITSVIESGPDALMRALQRLPDHGRIRVPGWTGPDPQKLLLGWTLHYAWNVPDGDGGQRIVVATDRYITFAEARNNPRVSDYPFTLLDIRLDKNGEGTGKASVATKITFDKKKNIMELENYSSEPVRLQNVKIDK
jgi:hypothetical protein